MEKIYSQSQKALFREIIWPSLVAIERKIDAKLTCMMTPQFDYGDENEPREGEVAYYLKLLKEEYGEAKSFFSKVLTLDAKDEVALKALESIKL